MAILRRLLVLALLPLLLAGCAAVQQAEAPAQADSEADSMVVDPQALQAQNPYLKKRGSVNGTARRRFASANAALASGDLEVARTDLEWLIENYPRLSGPYLNMALLQQQLGELEQAEQYFQATLEVNSRNLTGYNQYAVFLREQGRFEEAEQVYLAALAVWQDHAETHRNIGVLYDLYRGERQAALQHFYRYQALTGDQDRAVAGWIADLERQRLSLAQGGQ
ncbi:MAG: tetratricopeptide repeat protein [Halieaceae bacterium]